MQIHRRFARWEINHPVTLKTESALESAPAQIKDMSLKGMQLILEARLARDKFLKLSLKLSDDFVLDVEAWVVWHRTIDAHNVYGLYFTKIKDADKDKVYQFIRKNFSGELNKIWWQDAKEEKGEEAVEDRRVFDRLPVELPLRFIDLKRNQEGEARTADINAKGIGLVANEELPVQTPLEMWISVGENGERYYTRGEVVWSKKTPQNDYHMGVKLEKADLMGMAKVLRAA